MDLLLYEPEDFASDESYLKYYFRLNDTDVTFWQGWISNHPEKLDCIINADQLISLLALQLDESELIQEYKRLSIAIHDPDLIETPATIYSDHSVSIKEVPTHIRNPAFITKKNRLLRLIMAATVFFVIVATTWFFSTPLKKGFLSFESTTIITQDLLKKVNDGTEPSTFQLEDGSIITLQPGSALHYPQHFLTAKREVTLEGEAFFEVSKNKKRPFYVYCQNMVTHVLGTSFSIKTDRLLGKVEVTVRTGKVEIYPKDAAEKKELGKKSNGLILTPNQKAIYTEENNRFESSLVDTPLPILYYSEAGQKNNLQPDTIYARSTLISEILKSLEENYGIEIEIENENIGNCHFHGDSMDMNLYVRLDAICQSINATYEIKGTKILIRGKGCNW